MFILTLMPFIAFITKFMAKKVGVIKRQENKKIELFQDELGESMELFWQVKASNEEQSFRQRLIEKSDDIKEKSIEFKYKSEFFALISYFLFLAGFEMFRSAGIISVEYGELTIGKMLGIFGYLWVIMAPFQEILSIQYAYHTAKAALDRINGIFDMKLEPEYKEIKNPFKDTLTNSLEIKNLNFSYQKENQTLKDINIKAKKGKKIAIVGETGGGKSTLASLIVGFYQPDSGEILYDGVNYDEIGLDLIRQNVFLVLQSPLLFNNTIRYNLTFGKDVSESELKEAIKVAQLESFIASLENGLDEIVGKNGVKLSGGQRQRLSIARMLIAKPNIVILDESTSSLDVQTEDNLFLELSSFLKQRTTIIIAHRLSTITKADYIYLLKDGSVSEEGGYDELLKADGLFARYVKKGIK
jgi:ATP-binding cassette subfamily C protein